MQSFDLRPRRRLTLLDRSSQLTHRSAACHELLAAQPRLDLLKEIQQIRVNLDHCVLLRFGLESAPMLELRQCRLEVPGIERIHDGEQEVALDLGCAILWQIGQILHDFPVGPNLR